jgi:hypothetical protein
MPKCPQCEGGWRIGEVGFEPCYHCANSGEISEEQAFGDKVNAYALDLAIFMVGERKRVADEDPEGEPWAFHAAENGMREYEYTQTQVGIEQDRIKRELEKIELYVLTAIVDLWDTSNVPWKPTPVTQEVTHEDPNHREDRDQQQPTRDPSTAESEIPF